MNSPHLLFAYAVVGLLALAAVLLSGCHDAKSFDWGRQESSIKPGGA